MTKTDDDKKITLAPTPEGAAAAVAVRDLYLGPERVYSDPVAQQACIEALSCGATIRDVARTLDIRETTILHWLATSKEVQAALQRGVAVRKARVHQDIVVAGDDAVGALRAIVNDPTVDPEQRIKAATELLDRANMGAPPADSSPNRSVQIVNVGGFNHRLLSAAQGDVIDVEAEND